MNEELCSETLNVGDAKYTLYQTRSHCTGHVLKNSNIWAYMVSSFHSASHFAAWGPCVPWAGGHGN